MTAAGELFCRPYHLFQLHMWQSGINGRLHIDSAGGNVLGTVLVCWQPAKQHPTGCLRSAVATLLDTPATVCRTLGQHAWPANRTSCKPFGRLHCNMPAKAACSRNVRQDSEACAIMPPAYIASQRTPGAAVTSHDSASASSCQDWPRCGIPECLVCQELH